MTEFRGRGDVVEVYPLSFKEYYDFVGGDKSKHMKNIPYMVECHWLSAKKTDDEKYD